MSHREDHTAFERSLNVGFVGGAVVFLVFLSFLLLGFGVSNVILGVGVLLVPLLCVLTYYLSGGKTRDLGYYMDGYWYDEYPEWWGEGVPTSRKENAEPDSLATLRERYASGELTDEQFEHKLDRLLQTDTRENATEWRARTRERELSKE